MNARIFRWTLIWSLALASPIRAGESERLPIVAVFDIEQKGLDWPESVLDTLSDLLAAKLAESGLLQVVPRAQLRERLRAQKEESYRSCYEEACQIEIGRELSAANSIAAQFLRLGDECTLTLTLYDLSRATATGAATASGPCTEASASRLIELAVQKLLPAPGERQVPVDVESEPSGAEVFVEGRRAGMTPLRAALPQNRAVILRLVLPGYETLEHSVTVRGSQVLRFSLERARADLRKLRNRIDWVGLKVHFGGGSDAFLAGGGAEGITLKWDHFQWTLLDIGVGGVSSRDFFWLVGTRVYYPFYLTQNGDHQLKLGLGTGYWYTRQGEDDSSRHVKDKGLYFSPSLRYMFQIASRVAIGIEFCFILHANSGDYQGYPWAGFVTFPVVWTVAR
ncbi:MAG: PEGA domain-containing protein [Myxococcales bacterium]|nr:PEGA domain-containing protein [Myxococcales bacterium]